MNCVVPVADGISEHVFTYISIGRCDMVSISKFMTKKLLDAGITGYILNVYQKLSL